MGYRKAYISSNMRSIELISKHLLKILQNLFENFNRNVKSIFQNKSPYLTKVNTSKDEYRLILAIDSLLLIQIPSILVCKKLLKSVAIFTMDLKSFAKYLRLQIKC